VDEESPATPYDGRRAAAVAVACVAVIVTLLVTWAASIGPGTVVDGEGFGAIGTATPTPTSPSPTETGSPTQGGEQDRGDPPFVLQVLAVAMVVLGALALAALAGLALWQVWRLRPKLRVRREDLEFEVLPGAEPADAVSSAMSDDAVHQMELLREGTPRNGIVACWARFEEQAARAGVRPEAWETSSEFALRILDLVRADTSAVAALAELFREARFSEHEVTEVERSAAIERLAQIHASLGRHRVEVDS
jgi:ABC-type transporter Mla MlaB component